ESESGGSKRLGKEFAKLIASKDAHVAICARGKSGLDLALEELKELIYHAFDEASSMYDGRVPDVLFAIEMNLITEGTKRMAQQDAKNKIVMVSFVAELCGLWDLLRLAECLRHELIRYDISVHCYFAGTIVTPGYEEEEAAKTLYKGNFIISDIIGDAIRASTL
ncbi:37328_t:CDS:2, partial [Gigaspora margarita]